MGRTKGWAYAVATMLAVAGVIFPTSAAAQADFTQDFPAGQACSFPLHVAGTGGNATVRHAGGTISVTAGTGSALTFTNVENKNAVSFPSNGSATVSRTNPDGTQRFEQSGNNVLILFPTDASAVPSITTPSTTLIVGSAVVTIDTAGNWTLQRVSGRQTDICALLS